MRLESTKKFVKEANKLIKRNVSLDAKIELALERLKNNPFEPSLKTHKLKGKLDGVWSCSVTGDLRILFEILDDKNDKLYIQLLSIGKHDDVY